MKKMTEKVYVLNQRFIETVFAYCCISSDIQQCHRAKEREEQCYVSLEGFYINLETTVT